VHEVSIFILAGGHSTRMGTDKALLRLDGKTLLERALATARELSGMVKIVGARECYADFGADIVEDEFQQCGPLGGIHAALGASSAELNVVLSVDTPLVNAAFLRYLVDRAEAKPDALATVPDAAGGVQGTCAVYRRPFRAVAEQQLKRARNKITDTLVLVRVEYVEESEMRAAGFDPAMFANLNTPEEFARANEAKRA
jgi:molybdopterin-guanine dinucleotide biosynthesis protein A